MAKVCHFTFYPTSQEQESSQNSTTNVGTTRLPSITVDRTTNEVPSNRNTNHAQNSFFIQVLALPILHYHQSTKY